MVEGGASPLLELQRMLNHFRENSRNDCRQPLRAVSNTEGRERADRVVGEGEGR